MKYANLCSVGRLNINIGDYLQFLMIQSLYDMMQIDVSDIEYIFLENIKSYKGEKLLLPLNWGWNGMLDNNEINISPDIIPVFLAFTISSTEVDVDIDSFFANEKNRDFFFRYGPIGCRDAYTHDVFQQYGIPSYLNGCLTATLPRRKAEKTQSKIIFADVPLSLLPYIPKNLFDNYLITTQQHCFSGDEIKNYQGIFSFVKNCYDIYKNEAALIVTSRLHVASPCNAMGIPVIFAKDLVDYRFSWLEKLFPIYSPENFESINWSPQIVDYEDIKKEMIKLAISRIKSTFDIYNSVLAVSSFMCRKPELKKSVFCNSLFATHKNTRRLEKHMSKYWNVDKSVRYALWGISDKTDYWVDFIKGKYPNAKLVKVIDTFKTGNFHGLEIQHPDILSLNDDFDTIVVAASASIDAAKRFKKLNKPQRAYCLASDVFISDDDIFSRGV